MKKKMKSPFTLIEVMIGLSLSAIVLAFLFQFYTTLSRSHLELAKSKEEVLSAQRVQLRLNQVFGAVSEPFYLEKGALVFDFDNGIDPNPHFCGPVTGMLYLDEKKQLSLVTWSHLKEPRREVLVPTVSTYELSFFDQIDKKAWVSQWKKEVPAMTKLVVNDHTFVFFPFKTIETIYYDKKS
ncbi:MAG TPA: DUF1494 domain-containing protein [Rhabdochlamydiaceae bacterium]